MKKSVKHSGSFKGTEERRNRRTIRKVSALALSAVLLLSALSACSAPRPDDSNSGGKVTYTDMEGKKVTLSKNINRIVLTRSRDIYEFAALLGNQLPEKLVAWGSDLETADKDAYDKFTAEYPALKKVPVLNSDESSDDPEELAKYKPDLVFSDISFYDSDTDKKYRQAGLPVLYGDESTDPISSPQKTLALLGKVLGKEHRAQEIIDYASAKIDMVNSRISKISGKSPTVYLEAGNSGPAEFSQTYGSYGNPPQYTSWGTMLNELKAKSIADGLVANGMASINPEYVIKANPDVIVITGQNWTSASGTMRLGFYADQATAQSRLEGFLGRPGWSELNAVKSKRVYSVFHNDCMHIFAFAGYEALAKDLYPDQFKDIDPEKDLADFYGKYMPFGLSGVWSVSLS